MLIKKQTEEPQEWKSIPLDEFQGILMVIGAPDSGKTTLAQYLFSCMSLSVDRLAFLDGDPGQSVLGPPSTLTLAYKSKSETGFPPHGKKWRMFIGSVSPRGHMLQLLVAATRLVRRASDHGVDRIIYDTCGMINAYEGGLALKLAKINLLKPSLVIAIQREDELEKFLVPLRKSDRMHVITFKSSPEIQKRDLRARQTFRAERFRDYFENARRFSLSWNDYPVFPYAKFILGSIIALEDREGYTLALGLIEEINRIARKITLATPLKTLNGVNAIVLGDILLDNTTYHDTRKEIKWNLPS